MQYIRLPHETPPADGKIVAELNVVFGDDPQFGMSYGNLGSGHTAVARDIHRAIGMPEQSENPDGPSKISRLYPSFARVTPVLYAGEQQKADSAIGNDGFTQENFAADLGEALIVQAQPLHLMRPFGLYGSTVRMTSLFDGPVENRRTLKDFKDQLPCEVVISDEGVFGASERPFFVARCIALDDEPTIVDVTVDPVEKRPGGKHTNVQSPEHHSPDSIKVGSLILDPVQHDPSGRVDFSAMQLHISGPNPDVHHHLAAGLIVTTSGELEQTDGRVFRQVFMPQVPRLRTHPTNQVG